MQHELIITASTKKQKEEELQYLRSVKRAEATEAIKKAREYGDLSENHEYKAAREAQGMLNGRIAELETLLERAHVVPDPAPGSEEVNIGVMVKVLDLDEDEEEEYTIVDAASAEPMENRISYTSPLGTALMHHRVGDTVEFVVPRGTVRYKVIGLRTQS